jgi:hypothetical protein
MLLENSPGQWEDMSIYWSLITHKYRGSCVAFSISKSVEPNEELKVG